MFVFIIIWIFFLLIAMNEAYKGYYFYVVMFVIFNIVIIYAVIKSASESKDNTNNADNSNDYVKDNSSKNKELTDDDIEEIMFLEMMNKKKGK